MIEIDELIDKQSGGVCCYVVDPVELNTYWPRIIPWLERGRKYWEEYYDLKDIYVEIFAGNMTLWIVGDPEMPRGCFITTFRYFPKAKVFVFIFAAGDDDGVNRLAWGEALHDYMLQWARARGATHSRIEGRAGWFRIGRKLGYTSSWVAMVKSLANVWRH